MSSQAKNLTIEQARALEQSGQTKQAYDAYLKVGSYADAARLVAESGRPADAGHLLLRAIKTSPDQVATLAAGPRKLAYLAATYFAKGADTLGIAVEILVALGDHLRAADLLERSGDILGATRIRESRNVLQQPGFPTETTGRTVGGRAVNRTVAQQLEREGHLDQAAQIFAQLKCYGDAARLLQKMGRITDAAPMYAEAGMAYEAAVCYLNLGDTGKGMDNLVRVPRTSPKYQSAAVEAIVLASKLQVLPFQLEHFLTSFLSENPQNSEEVDALYELQILYERHGLLENAREALVKILTANPNYRDAAASLKRIDAVWQGNSAVFQRLQAQESAFQGNRLRGAPTPRPEAVGAVPGFSALPELPPAPLITGLDLTPGTAPTDQMAVPRKSAPQAAEAIRDFAPGRVIQSRYKLLSEIGRGGMAAVFAAWDLELDENVALKVFLQQVLDPKVQKTSEERFKQELKLSRMLAHPNIIRLYDIGLHNGFRYISMELLQGLPMEELLRGPMELTLGLSYLVQICHGLSAAHERGVIHRDIKPDNIFVTARGTVKIMDFGIAKSLSGQGLTIAGMTAGTPEYIAPEQISNFSAVTPVTDQYSLGMIAYRMFAGVLPFKHEELTPLLMMHLNATPASPRDHNPAIPPALEAIILRLIAKKPEARYSSCTEVVRVLEELRQTLSSTRGH